MYEYQARKLAKAILTLDKPEFHLIRGVDVQPIVESCNKGNYNGVNFVVLVSVHCLVTTGYRFIEVMIHMTDDNGKMAESEEIIDTYRTLVPELTPVFKQKDQYCLSLEQEAVETWCYLLSTDKEISKETRSHEVRSTRVFL